jgi:hypothetical protein
LLNCYHDIFAISKLLLIGHNIWLEKPWEKFNIWNNFNKIKLMHFGNSGYVEHYKALSLFWARSLGHFLFYGIANDNLKVWGEIFSVCCLSLWPHKLQSELENEWTWSSGVEFDSKPFLRRWCHCSFGCCMLTSEFSALITLWHFTSLLENCALTLKACCKWKLRFF